MHKSRIENISDGIFAIIMTLMVIEMKSPEGDLHSIFAFAKDMGIYGLSYVMIIIFWIHHHYLFSIMKQINNTIMVCNFLWIFFITLIPIPTRALGDNFRLSYNHAFYGGIMALNMMALFLLEWQIHKNLLRGSKFHRLISFKTLFVLLLYSVSILLSFINIYISAAIFAISPFLYTALTRKDRLI